MSAYVNDFFFFLSECIGQEEQERKKVRKKQKRKNSYINNKNKQFIFASVVFNLDVNLYNLSITGCLDYVLVFSCGLILLYSCLQSAAVKVL